MVNPVLFIPTKESAGEQNRNITIAFRTIERWTRDLPQIPSGGGGAYASLTGPGQTTTPGQLTQQGPFWANDLTVGNSIMLRESTGGIFIESGTQSSSLGSYTGTSGGTFIYDNGIASTGGAGGFMKLATDGEFHIQSGQSTAPYPTSAAANGLYIENTAYGDPGGDGLYITNDGDGGLTLHDRAGTTPVGAGTGGIAILEGGNGGILLSDGGTGGITLSSSSNISITASSGLGVTCIQPITIQSTFHTVTIQGQTGVFLPSLPTTNPGVANQVWRNGNVLNIV